MRKEDQFSIYRLLVQKRLTRHGFERPCQMDEDLDQQDKLATWIEFLNYEYQDYDKDMRFIERHQPEYDAAWKEPLDSKVLRPFETKEFLCNIKSSFQRASERERGREGRGIREIGCDVSPERYARSATRSSLLASDSTTEVSSSSIPT
jgi:hypothetical protein